MAVNRVVFGDPTTEWVNESVNVSVDMTFLDGHTPSDPGAFQYRVDGGNKSEMIPWTLVDPAATNHTLVIPPSVNIVEVNTQHNERRQLLVADTSGSVLGKLNWVVLNTGLSQAAPDVSGAVDSEGFLLTEGGEPLVL